MNTLRSLLTRSLAALVLLTAPALAAPVQLTTSTFHDVVPQWNADGTKIAFARQVSSGGIFNPGQVNANGTSEGFLATGVNIQSYGVSWLGSQLLVAEVNVFHELFAFNAAGYTTAAPFARTISDGNDAAFTRKLFVPGGSNSNIFIASRDGTRVAWRHSPNSGGSTSIRTALYSTLTGQNTDAVGTVLLSSTNAVYGLRGMALSPDGTKLYISLPTTGTGFDLWRYNTDGSGSPLQLTTDGSAGIFNGAPDVSPDGTKLLFARGAIGVVGAGEIYQMNIDGTGLTNVTNTAGVDEGQPAWAPNGTDYAFIRLDSSTNWNIYKDTLPTGSTSVTINFDDMSLGVKASNFLAGYGIPSVTFGGTGPGAGGPRIFDNTGSNHVIPSPPNLLAQDGNSNDPNQTHFLRFNFSPELTAFSLKRTGKNGGGSTDTWQAYFYNAAGTLLGQFGEATPIINAPVTTFSFTAPVGQTIARMDLVSIWTNFATNRNIPVDDFTLTRSATGDTTTQAPTLTSPATGTSHKSPVSVAFSLPEAALSGSVKLLLSGAASRTLTLAASQETSGAHSFSFNPASPTGSAQIASITGGSTVPDGTYTVTLSYQDAAGNAAATAASTSVVIDTVTQTPTLGNPSAGTYGHSVTTSLTFPEPALAGSVTLTFDDGVTPRVLTLANSVGASGGGIGFSFDPANPTATAQIASGAPIPAGTYSVALSYQDALGNAAASATRTGIVLDLTTQAPTLTAPATGTVTSSPITVTYSLPEAAQTGTLNLSFGATLLTLAAADGTAGAHSFTFNPASPTASGHITSGAMLADGTYSVSLSYQDVLGNPAASSATATNVVIDTTAPMLSLPSNITAEATSAAGQVVTYSASASDPGGSGVASASFVPPSGSTFAIGTTTVNASATDNAGNTATGSFTVTVQDTMGPVLSLPAAITAEATGPTGATVTFSTTAMDLVDGARPVFCSPASGSLFPLGTVTVMCSSTDTHGNPSSGSFTVTVQDTTPPVLSLPANIATVATGASGATVTFSVTASDIVSGSLTPAVNPPSGSTFPIGTTTVNVSATDGASNTQTGSFTVTVTPGVFMIQPDAATVSYDFHVGTPAQMIDQSGLSVGYTEGVTDFDSYLAGNPTHNGIPAANVWYGDDASSGTATFDLGVAHTVSAMVLWGAGPEGVKDFTLLVSNDPTFAVAVTAGSFTATNTGPETARPAQRFDFPEVSGRYVRMNITSQYHPNTVAMGEVAFRGGPSAPAPEIVVEQPAGTGLVDGTGSIVFGNVSFGGSSAPKTVTITNAGTADLILGAFTKDGANPGDFSVSAPGSTTVTAGNSTTFTVTYTPGAGGGRSAALHIASNVSGAKNPFDLTLTGTDAPIPQTIIFGPLGGKTFGDADFTVSATGGASGEPVTFTASGLASVSGSTVTITGAGDVTITAHQAGTSEYAAASDVSQSFTVAKAAQTITFNPPAMATTTDTVTLSATTPAPGAVSFSLISGPGSLLGDALTFTGVGSVVVRASHAGDANYFAAPDVNRTIVVRLALALANDSAFAGTAAVLIDVLANDAGGTGTRTLQSVTQPASGGVASIFSGKVKFMRNAPATTPITFTYTAGDGVDSASATVTVHPLSGTAGTYVGLLRRTDNSIRGRVVVTVTATGAATGSVRRDGNNFNFTGSILGEGRVTFYKAIVPVPAPMTLTPGPLDGAGQWTLAVSMADSVVGQRLSATAERSPYSATSPAPQAGRYTIVAKLPSGGTGPQTGAAMTCTVAADGTVKFAGKLGNDVAVLQGGKLLSGGRLPFYVSTGTGAALQRMTGEPVFDKTATPAVDGTLHWSVPAGTVRLPGGVEQDYEVFGLPYTPPALPSGMFSPPVPSATLTLTIPSLGAGSPVVRTVALTTPPIGSVRRVGFSGGYIDLLPGSGAFRGGYGVGRGYFGVVLQGGGVNAGQGWLLEPTTINPVTLAP